MSRPLGITDEEWRSRERKRIAVWRAKHYKRESAKWKEYRLTNLEHERKRVREWWAIPTNRKRMIAIQVAYNKAHPEVNKKAVRKYAEKNRSKIRVKNRAYATEQRKSGKQREYTKHRYLTDPQFNLSRKIRGRIRMAFKKANDGSRKHDTTIKLLGCSYAEFKNHIESQFTEGMTWAKVIDGSIHIDHKTPIASFDLTDSLQQKAAFHFLNCQPLWSEENLSKGDKIIPFEIAA